MLAGSLRFRQGDEGDVGIGHGGGRPLRFAFEELVGLGVENQHGRGDPVGDTGQRVVAEGAGLPDTGNLVADVRQYLEDGRAVLSHPLARTIIPDMLAEAARNPELATVLAEHVREPRRAKAAELFERALRRGELPPGTDITLAMDLLAGPLYWRQSVMQVQADDAYCDQLATAIVAALSSSASLQRGRRGNVREPR